MTTRAHVTSVEAIDAFRSSLILYLNKARPALEEVCDDVLRTRLWLQNDRRSHWEREVRRRTKELEQAQQELLNARLSRLREETAAQLMAVDRAKRALREAEEKQALLKRWNREFGNRTEPLTRQVGQLHTFLTTDMLQAVASLAQTLKTLEAYAAVPTPGASPGTGRPRAAAEGMSVDAAGGEEDEGGSAEAGTNVAEEERL